jgi:hypothetical protein
VIVSLLYKVLSVPAVLFPSESAKDAELLVLRHENVVLRRQLTGPVRYEPADRFWFAALSRLVHRSHWQRVFPVTPGTLLGWHQVHCLEVGLHRTSANRASLHPGGDQGARTPACQRKSAVGTSADPWRAPAHHRRHRASDTGLDGATGEEPGWPARSEPGPP